jgi:2-dehydropantoate 2-reductase
LTVTLQNGLGNDLILSNILGPRRDFRGATTLGAPLLVPGSVRSSGEGVVTLERHPRLDGMEEMLRQARLGVNIAANMEPIVWGKLVINAAINPLTALLRVKNGDLLTNQPAHDLMIQLAGEVAKVAEALPVKLPFLDPECAVEDVAQHTAENMSSILQDVLRGAPIEVEAINGEVIRIGEQKGILLPVNRTICSLVNTLPVRDKI